LIKVTARISWGPIEVSLQSVNTVIVFYRWCYLDITVSGDSCPRAHPQFSITIYIVESSLACVTAYICATTHNSFHRALCSYIFVSCLASCSFCRWPELQNIIRSRQKHQVGVSQQGLRPPLGATEPFSGATSRGLRGHQQRPLLNSSAVILQNPINEQEGTSVDSLWKEATNHRRLRAADLGFL